MSRKRTPRSRGLSAASSTRRTRGGKTSEKRGEKPIAPNATRQFSHRHPLLMFLLIFAVLLAVFYVFIAFSRSYNKRFLPSYHNLIAKVSGDLLAILGHDTTVAGTSISSPRFSVQIVRGCDAVEAIALYVCAVLAFPLPFLKKLPGIIIGA
ncbi:MAG: hypothetical protein ACYS80_19210, partial [Planctomycetota bacterium]